MNLFETVKENVTLRQAAENYGFDISRSDMICCPFHNDDSPSMKLYDDHFYCFGCGEHGDVIDFTGKLFSLSPKEAAERLTQDFGICYDSDEHTDTSKYRKDSILRRIKASQEKEKENHVYNVLSSYFRLLQEWKRDYAPASPDDIVDPRFTEALTKSAYIEHLLDRMMAGSKEKGIADGEIVRIEKVVKRHEGNFVTEIQK
ncbi:CHC2 zinc finger domain-containing protein [Ruminococcus sp. HUN007]|uniref:CHC2 zinc finger domain-containing protein n=1 Tax=Ruminococcus sp. HUN007 TaxID=1514668 RepID=UPI0005D1C8EE|nr:CHC2 zinc finger domain-containing protein [Ruminococcus sp. HUN007]